MARIELLFPTRIYRAPLGGPDPGRFLGGMEASCNAIAGGDRAGQAWCRANAYPGYTSYASLNDLTARAPEFAELERRAARHVAAFARALGFDLRGRKLELDSMWVNILSPGGAHTGHIHPASVISGTLYVSVPGGAGAIRFEDPRLGFMMASPGKRRDAPRDAKPFVYLQPKAGSLILFESWLRHEVPPNASRRDRISVSFNFA